MRKKTIYPLLVAFLSLLAISPLFCQTRQHENDAVTSIEKELLVLLNRERAARGILPLSEHPMVKTVSLGHSRKMLAEETLSHEFPGYKSLKERLEVARLDFTAAGENVAFSQYPQASTIHEGFMNSPGHRDNLLDGDYTHCGIAVVKQGRDLYVTQTFVKLFIPLAGTEILAELERDLADYFRKQYGFELVLMPTAQPFAQSCAEHYLSGLNPQPESHNWGSFYKINLLGTDTEALKKELRRQIKYVKFHGAALGAAAGTSARYHRGTYAVTALLFPGSPFHDTPYSRLVHYVLKEVNKIRFERSNQPLQLDDSLSRDALELAHRHYDERTDKLLDSRERQVIVYQTYDPRGIPREFENFLASQTDLEQVGVGVFSPLRNGLPGNFFIVGLILAQ